MAKESKTTNDDVVTVEDVSGKLYEIGYLIVPTVPQAELEEEVDAVLDAITDNDGEIQYQQSPELRDLAYAMEQKTESGRQEFDSAHFGWVQFSIDPSNVEAAQERINAREDVLRTLLITIDEVHSPEADSADEEELEEIEE